MSTDFWSLDQALGWVMWRVNAPLHTLKLSGYLIVLSSLGPDESTSSAAVSALLGAWRDGRIEARGRRNGKGVLIPIDVKENSDLVVTSSRGLCWLETPHNRGDFWTDVTFAADQVRAAFPEFGNTTTLAKRGPQRSQDVSQTELTDRARRSARKRSMYKKWYELAMFYRAADRDAPLTQLQIAKKIATDQRGKDPVTKKAPAAATVIRRLNRDYPDWKVEQE
jgi:hypothetical protein